MTEWAEGALVGFLGGVGVGVKLKSDLAVLISILADTAIGALAGSQVQFALNPSLATRDASGNWTLLAQSALPPSRGSSST
jgi:hypothetical protein